MIRDNEDVFNLFCKNAKDFKYEYDLNDGFVETMVNFMFRDLTQCKGDKKLAVLIREIIKSEVEESDSPTELLRDSMTEKIFKELIQMSETKKYLLYLFKNKFERVDFNYID